MFPPTKSRFATPTGEYISGVVASKLPHFMTAEEKGKNLPLSAMVIDVGATSAEEVVKDFKIRVGARLFRMSPWNITGKTALCSAKRSTAGSAVPV